MPDQHPDGPLLLDPVRSEQPLTSWMPLVALGVGLAVALGAGMGKPSRERTTPYTADDLGSSLVTPIDAGDPVALARAFEHLAVAPAERERIRAGVADGRMRLGLIGFFDDMDPDGDAVLVAGAGHSQRVVLGAGLTPVVTPYAAGGPITVTAVYDGGGTVTVALLTRSGPVHLKRLLVGESVEVAAP